MVRMVATDQPSYCCRPLSARPDAPTPLRPPGFGLLLIGGGCPYSCRRCGTPEQGKKGHPDKCRSPRHLRHVAGRGARRKTEERGRRAPTRGTALVVRPERSGGNIISQAAGHGQVADLNGERR
jgi:hypothetical protein